jgi:hypothetical protein
MRVLSRAITRVSMAVGSVAVFGFAVFAAAPTATATPATANVPFSSCAFGQPAHTPLVVLVTARGRNAGFEDTGPYDLVARGILGPFAKLVNYGNCRVWLHQFDDPFSKGWSVCFNPRRFGSSPVVAREYEFAGSMVISGSTSPCP